MAQDYIMRLIEQIGQLLASILAHKHPGRDREAMAEIEAVCLEHVGVPMSLVRRSSPEGLWALLAPGGALRYPRAILLAELLLQDAELSERTGRNVAALCAQLQAFSLLRLSIDLLTIDEAAVYRPKLEALARKLQAARNDPEFQGCVATVEQDSCCNGGL
jgi:hypothetical protein